jgi:hypothetical protein
MIAEYIVCCEYHRNMAVNDERYYYDVYLVGGKHEKCKKKMHHLFFISVVAPGFSNIAVIC